MQPSTATFLTITLLIIISYAKSQNSIGDLCTNEETNARGECKLLKDCPSALSKLQNERIWPERCGFLDREPIICCEGNSQQVQRPVGQISKEKCIEYAKFVKIVRPSPVALIRPPNVTRQECGHKVQKLIVGGLNATRKEFPHMAVVGYQKDENQPINWLCGGTILSDYFILTAGHCLSHFEWGKALWVKVGVTDINDRTSRVQTLKVANQIAQPDYRSSTHYNDIGLLKLETPIKLNPFARPACLYPRHDTETQQVIATGWGRTGYEGERSELLQKVTLDIFNHTFCNNSYKANINRKLKMGIVDDIQMCAGSLSEEKDTCQGDSGGPLQIYHDAREDKAACMYDIVGVTSFGKACSGSPGVYARVSHYLKWIEDTVWPE